jgi:biotin operon repressor
MTQLKIAELTKDDVSKIEKLEAQSGFHIMAFEKGYKLAKPTEKQLAQIQELEKVLGVTLLAYIKD